MIRIPVFDVAIQNRRLMPELEAAIREVLLEGQTDVVPQVSALEQEIARLVGVPHAIGVQSGSAGLFLALKALGIGPSDEVITAPNSDISTTAAISHAGARFVLCDVEPEAMTLDPRLVEAAITPRTRAIIPVHLYGQPAAMDPLMAIAERHRLVVLEDATLSLGATYHTRFTGSIGTAAVFSFAATKVIGGAGNGGMVVTRDPDLALRVRLLRGYGMHPSKQELPPQMRHTIDGSANLAEGFNLRLDSLEAAILRVKLRQLSAWQLERGTLADRYAAHFAGTRVRAPTVRTGCTHTWRSYVVLLPNRDRVKQTLRERGIATNVLYAPPVHLQPVYEHLDLGRGSFPVAERLGDQLLGLPLYPGLRPEQVDEVAGAVLGGPMTPS